jgi:hypothetical protein
MRSRKVIRTPDQRVRVFVSSTLEHPPDRDPFAVLSRGLAPVG